MLYELYSRSTWMLVLIIEILFKKNLISPYYTAIVNVRRKDQVRASPTTDQLCELFYKATSETNQ